MFKFSIGTLALCGFALGGNANQHTPIVIQSDQDFLNCACLASGSGSPSDPYVIGPLAINKVNGIAVTIDGSALTKSFVLWNLTIAGNGSSSSTGILLKNINGIAAAVQGPQTVIQSLGVGISIQNSTNIKLDGGGANPSGAGIAGSKFGTINKNFTGAIDVENSSYILIKGWQFSANGQDGTPDWVALDPSLANWGVGGIRFFGVTSSTIDHNAANNCTSISYSLFNSSYNTVSNNTADYPFTMNFLVADGSSFNLVTGNVASTGDFIGYMVADPLPGTSTLATYGASHDNVFSSNISHSDGPTGAEKKAGVVPAFLGGFLVLNGTYNNTLQNNQDWASVGSGFAWAQAVPSGTSIGVVTYPPALHCNVTASEGGGGVVNLNGNIWAGNTFQTIDPCIPAQ
jgi:parallel beta-helix repeat protein